MQNFETLFRRAWERGRDFKLSVCILLNWLLLTVLAGVIVAAATGAYFALIERKQAAQSIVEVNPPLCRIFAPKRVLKLSDARLSFGSRHGDRLNKVVVRTPSREFRAKSAELRINAEEDSINLTLRRYRVYAVDGEKVGEIPVTGDDLGSLQLYYPFKLPPELNQPEKPVPGDIARGWVVVAGIVVIGMTLWCWIWQMLSTGVSREVLDGGPTRVLRGFRSGLARWRTVMYPVPLLTLCGIVSVIGSLPNVLSLPLPFFLALYPLACALEITLLMLCGIMLVGAAVNPPETSFGTLFRESVRVFLNGWGRYLLGIFWVYAFLALFAVMLVPALLPLGNAAIFGDRVMLAVAAVWIAVWLAAFIVTGVRVRGCIAAYHVYLYLDAAGQPGSGDAPVTAQNPESDGK